MMWEEIVKQLGFFGLILAALTYLGRKYIEHLGFQAQTKFSLLHNRRADMISELYTKIMNLERAMGSFLGPQTPGTSKSLADAVEKAGNEFTEFYQNHEVWFPEEVCDELYKMNENMRNAYNLILSTQHPQLTGIVNIVEQYKAAHEAFKTSGQVVRTKLRKQFRELLGVK